VDERQIAKRSPDPQARREAISREELDREFARLDAEEAAAGDRGQVAVQRALDTMNDMNRSIGDGTSPLLRREIVAATGDERFRHLITSGGLPGQGGENALSAARISAEGALRQSSGARAFYGPGVYTYGPELQTSKDIFIEFSVSPGTAIEKLTFKSQKPFYRLVPSTGENLNLVNPRFHNVPSVENLDALTRYRLQINNMQLP
jgi:hypothetical protein